MHTAAASSQLTAPCRSGRPQVLLFPAMKPELTDKPATAAAAADGIAGLSVVSVRSMH